jgi:hypothetical protein
MNFFLYQLPSIFQTMGSFAPTFYELKSYLKGKVKNNDFKNKVKVVW